MRRQVSSLLRLLSQTVAGLRPHLRFREAHMSPVMKTGSGSREVPLAARRLPMLVEHLPRINGAPISLEANRPPAADPCLQYYLFRVQSMLQ